LRNIGRISLPQRARNQAFLAAWTCVFRFCTVNSAAIEFLAEKKIEPTEPYLASWLECKAQKQIIWLMQQNKVKTVLRQWAGIEGLGYLSIVLALLCSTIRTEAGPPNEDQTSIIEVPSSPFRVTIVEENPTMAAYGRDRHYTNGFKFALTSCQLADDSIWNLPVRLLRSVYVFNRPGDGTDNRLEWTPAAQDIFTPQDHTHKFVSPNDRPFAGWLYAGFNWIQNDNDQQLTSLEIQGGIVGSWAIGRQVQNGFHDIFNIGRVRGWRSQLGNEFGAVGFWDRKWRFNHDLGNGYSWEIIPGVELATGNIFTYAGVNALLRWGRGLKSNWGPDMIRPGYSGTSYFSAERGGVPIGFDIYLGTQGRLVAQNIFLDGNTLQNSRSVNKEIAVGDALAGAEVFYRDYLRAGFTFMLRSNEFTKQRGPDTFGGFYLSFAY
jgi:lipid A 3-O-deacylase